MYFTDFAKESRGQASHKLAMVCVCVCVVLWAAVLDLASLFSNFLIPPHMDIVSKK